ncbi:hypothetical protein GCM10009733_001950 [Nonomuraea maheshkhaliensis]|uniref:Uncharacterized protein n=1 Tax=Nonomuraea maheshkhaliensis TaxID=419590 RepID=A0ABN2EJX4_9ACTN
MSRGPFGPTESECSSLGAGMPASSVVMGLFVMITLLRFGVAAGETGLPRPSRTTGGAGDGRRHVKLPP